jgi:hypothetical protein
MVPLLREEADDVANDDALLAAATATIRATIDRGPLPARLEAPYEYRAGRYAAVHNPRWWFPTW